RSRSAPRRRCSSRTVSSRRPARGARAASRPSSAMADREKGNDQEWALQRRLEDVFAKLGEKFGDLTGRVETQIRPTVTFDDVGGVRQAKAELRGFAVALTNPDLYALCEKLDAMEPSTRVLVVATTTRTDALDPTLVAPGRLDHLIEIALPDTDDQREILELIRGRTEKNAGRQLFAPIDYDKVLPVMGGMSGADISVIVRRTLEAKVHAAAAGVPPSLVTTEDVLDAIDGYKR